jgi:hypothetical protein
MENNLIGESNKHYKLANCEIYYSYRRRNDMHVKFKPVYLSSIAGIFPYII